MLLDLVTLPGRDPVTFVDEISAVSAPRREVSCGRIRCVDLRDSALLSRRRGPASVSTSPSFRRASLATAARFRWLQRPRFAQWGCSTGAYRTSCGSSGKGRRANLSNTSRVIRRNGEVDPRCTRHGRWLRDAGDKQRAVVLRVLNAVGDNCSERSTPQRQYVVAPRWCTHGSTAALRRGCGCSVPLSRYVSGVRLDPVVPRLSQ